MPQNSSQPLSLSLFIFLTLFLCLLPSFIFLLSLYLRLLSALLSVCLVCLCLSLCPANLLTSFLSFSLCSLFILISLHVCLAQSTREEETWQRCRDRQMWGNSSSYTDTPWPTEYTVKWTDRFSKSNPLCVNFPLFTRFGKIILGGDIFVAWVNSSLSYKNIIVTEATDFRIHWKSNYRSDTMLKHVVKKLMG